VVELSALGIVVGGGVLLGYLVVSWLDWADCARDRDLYLAEHRKADQEVRDLRAAKKALEKKLEHVQEINELGRDIEAELQKALQEAEAKADLHRGQARQNSDSWMAAVARLARIQKIAGEEA
jgi:hypothetical protein